MQNIQRVPYRENKVIGLYNWHHCLPQTILESQTVFDRSIWYDMSFCSPYMSNGPLNSACHI